MTSLAIRVEQALLGSVLLEPAGQQHVLDLVEPGDMYRPWHGQVLSAMQRVRGKGLSPGPAEVYEELRVDPDLPGNRVAGRRPAHRSDGGRATRSALCRICGDRCRERHPATSWN